MLFENYTDEILAEFIPKYTNAVARYRLQEDLRLADTIAVTRNVGQTKKGNQAYSRWRNSKLKLIDDLKRDLEIENMTVFERLKMKVQKRTSTVFDRLKRFGEE